MEILRISLPGGAVKLKRPLALSVVENSSSPQLRSPQTLTSAVVPVPKS